MEPEVLCDGDHDLHTALRVTEEVSLLPSALIYFVTVDNFVKKKKSNIDPLQNVMLLRTCSVADVETEIDNSEE